MTHGLLRPALEVVPAPQHEGAVGDKAVEGIAHEGELEIAAEIRVPQTGPHLLQGQVAMLDRGQVRPREALVDEQAHLLDVLVAHLLAQGLAHRMGPGLGNGCEDEAVAVGNDHITDPTKEPPTSITRWGACSTIVNRS